MWARAKPKRRVSRRDFFPRSANERRKGGKGIIEVAPARRIYGSGH